MDRYPVLTPHRVPHTVPESFASPRGRWLRWWIFLGLICLLTSLLIVVITVNPFSSPATENKDQDEVERLAVAVAYVDVEGGVRPLFPAVPGRVIEAPVQEGQEVEEGTVLLRIDDEIAKTKLRAAKLELKAAEERLTQAMKLIPQHKSRLAMQQANVNMLKKKLAGATALANKVLKLRADNLNTKEDVDAANSAVEEAREGVRAAEEQLEQTRMLDPSSAVKLAETDLEAKREAVEAAQLMVNQCRILAPTKGMILRRLVNVGEMIGQHQTRPAIEFCPSGDRIVRAEVEQEFAGRLHIGQKVRISDDITGAGDWQGEVRRISNWFTQRRAVLLEPMQYNDIRTLEVIISLKDDPKNTLRINQRVRVKLGKD